MITFPFTPADTTLTSSENCTVSYINAAGDLTYSNTINTTYTGNRVNVIKFFKSVPFQVPQEVTYADDKIIIGEDQYFLTDDKERVIEYRGSVDPAKFPYFTEPVFVQYYYDGNNNIVKAKIMRPDSVVKREVAFIWNDGVITKAIERFPFLGYKTEIEYEYYTDKTVKSLPYTATTLPELFYFQPVISFGNHVRHPLKMSTTKIFDNRDKLVTSYTRTFNGYIVDNNGYVLHFTEANEYGARTRFSFDYTCF
jgi:hypothetical protein